MKTIALLSAVLLGSSAFAATTNDPASALQKGLFEEEANHNLPAAIQLYHSVVAQFEKDRRLAATAVFRLGECYRKQGDTNASVAQYQRVLSDFPDQTELIPLSRQNLLALGASLGPASAAPAGSTAARDEQKRLLEQEIKLVEQQLASEQKRVETGKATADSVISTQRELLNLKRQLAALEASAPRVVDLLSPGDVGTSMTSTEAEEVKRIQAMIKDSPDLINAPDAQRLTPLIKAAMNGQPVVVQFLINAGADLELKDGSGSTALYKAASKGHKAIVELLLAHKAQPDNPGPPQKTPLDAAAENGFRAVAEVLLSHGAKVNAEDSEKATPLHYAVANGFRSVAELLLDQGADVNANAREVYGAGRTRQFCGTPIQIAASRGDLPVVELLFKRKADPNIPADGAGTNPNMGGGLTPLDAAAVNNSASVAAALLAHGAQINHKNATEAYRGWTALHYAVASNARETVEVLLRNGGDPNARTEADIRPTPQPGGSQIFQARSGSTPLVIATAKCNAGIAEALLLAKADPNFGNDPGDAPLLNAMSCNSQDRARILPLLLEHGAATEAKNQYGLTALLIAVQAKDKESVQLLLKHKASPNARDNSGNTALHYVSRLLEQNALSLLQIAKDLIAAGADVNAQYSDGYTPLKITTGLLARGFHTSADDALKEFAGMLRKAGAVEDIPQMDRIEVSRRSANFNAPVFWKGTNDYNRFSLFELIAVEYGLCSAPPAPGSPGPVFRGTSSTRVLQFNGGSVAPGEQTLSFPDFLHVVIHRATADGKGRREIAVDLATIFRAGAPSGDMVLNWGDVVEIPEADHPVSASWQGLPDSIRDFLTKCLTRSVEVRIKGETAPIVLKPAQRGFSAQDFTLPAAIGASGLLRASSDLSRVKVTRHDVAAGQTYELQVDCSPSGSGRDLWLRDGDVIEVPEKS